MRSEVLRDGERPLGLRRAVIVVPRAPAAVGRDNPACSKKGALQPIGSVTPILLDPSHILIIRIDLDLDVGVDAGH
jgi:hypothetical protein